MLAQIIKITNHAWFERGNPPIEKFLCILFFKADSITCMDSVIDQFFIQKDNFSNQSANEHDLVIMDEVAAVYSQIYFSYGTGETICATLYDVSKNKPMEGNRDHVFRNVIQKRINFKLIYIGELISGLIN